MTARGDDAKQTNDKSALLRALVEHLRIEHKRRHYPAALVELYGPALRQLQHAIEYAHPDASVVAFARPCG